MSTAGFLVAEKLECIRGDIPLFGGVHFQVFAGKSLQVVGPNGIGKSSLLRLIAGLLPSDLGQLQWNLAPGFAESCVLINHLQGLKSELTVAETLQFWNRLAGQPRTINLEAILTRWSLQALAHFPTGVVSQGQRQRLQLARLHLSSAWLWLLDEPCVGLDALGQRTLLQHMQAHQDQGGAVILTSHHAFSGTSGWRPDQQLDLSHHSLVQGRNAA